MAGMQQVFNPGYQQTQYQSSNPYGNNYRPPTGPQGGGTPVGPTAPKSPTSPLETEEERRRRQALILGAPYEGLGGGDGGNGDGGAASAGGGDGGSAGNSGADGAGSGTGGTY